VTGRLGDEVDPHLDDLDTDLESDSFVDDHGRDTARAQRTSPVAKAEVSPAAKRKHETKRTDDGLPVHSFRSCLPISPP
jgi:hypothetical protein